ncbi:hypothetical protein, partial [Burkholderia pseudomallei]|uniref:hypothetical protein n=1 Tax=Burkholderia pseudomallei TaxID=28450 RepID=UPI0021F6F524
MCAVSTRARRTVPPPVGAARNLRRRHRRRVAHRVVTRAVPSDRRQRGGNTMSTTVEQAISPGLAYAPYADLAGCEPVNPA